MPTPVRTLKDFPLPDLLGPAVTLPAGCELFHPGRRADHVYYIVSGSVRLIVSRAGGRDVAEGIRRAGWLLAAGPALKGLPHRTRAVATEATVVQSAPASAFVEAFWTNGNVSRFVALRYIDEQFDNEASIAMLGGGDGTFRLEQYLAAVAGEGSTRLANGNLRLNRTPTHAEIGRAIAVSARHAGRLLMQLVDGDHLSIDKGWLILPARGRLAALMGDQAT